MVKKKIDSKQNNWLYLSIVAIVAIAAIVVMSMGVSKLSLTSGQTAIISEDDLAGQASRKIAYTNKCFYSPPDECSYDSSDSSLPKEFIGCGNPDKNMKCKDICGSSWENSYLCEEKQLTLYTKKSLKITPKKIIVDYKKTPTEFCFFSSPDGCSYESTDPSLPKNFLGCSNPDKNMKCKDFCGSSWENSYLCYK